MRCCRLAIETRDPAVYDYLLKLAEELEAKAAEMQAQERGPKE
jgi:hypothetical protein